MIHFFLSPDGRFSVESLFSLFSGDVKRKLATLDLKLVPERVRETLASGCSVNFMLAVPTGAGADDDDITVLVLLALEELF